MSRLNVMNHMMCYKDYLAQVTVDLERNVIFGRVTNLKDVITFQGRTPREAYQAFCESVDDYLAFCGELGEKPEKPLSGKLLFRTTPERHRRILVAAQLEGKSINAWIDESLAAEAERTIRERSGGAARAPEMIAAATSQVAAMSEG
jgi:predicted HicB family RNase H-like nuclease